MKYYINGDLVSESIFDRDMEDNFNAGIDFTSGIKDGNAYMNYEDEA